MGMSKEKILIGAAGDWNGLWERRRGNSWYTMMMMMKKKKVWFLFKYSFIRFCSFAHYRTKIFKRERHKLLSFSFLKKLCSLTFTQKPNINRFKTTQFRSVFSSFFLFLTKIIFLFSIFSEWLFLWDLRIAASVVWQLNNNSIIDSLRKSFWCKQIWILIFTTTNDIRSLCIKKIIYILIENKILCVLQLKDLCRDVKTDWVPAGLNVPV